METGICCWVQRAPGTGYAEAQALAMLKPIMVSSWFHVVETAIGWSASHWVTLVRNGIQQLGGREWERRKRNLLV